jgi:hypothetical protein
MGNPVPKTRVFFCVDTGKDETYRSLMGLTGLSRDQLKQRAANRKLGGTISLKDFADLGQANRADGTKKVKPVHHITIEMPDGETKRMPLAEVSAAMNAIFGMKTCVASVRTRWIARGCPDNIALVDLANPIKQTKRYRGGRKRRAEKFEALTARDVLGIKNLAAAVINDAVKVYCSPLVGDGRVKRDNELAKKKAAFFLFKPGNPMRKFWEDCVDIKIPSKIYLDNHRDEINRKLSYERA